MKLKELYETRRQAWVSTTIRYTKLVANSGFMFSLYVALIIGGVYYQKALKALPAHFPSAVILTVLFAAFLVPSPIRTYVQRADLIFLLPAEHDLGDYFRKAVRSSWLRQSIVFLFVAAVGMPLYLKTLDASVAHYGSVVVLFILLKGWNIYGSWCETQLTSSRGYFLLRSLISMIFIFFVLRKASWVYVGLLLIILIGVSVWGFRPVLNKTTLNWIRLVNEEADQAMRFLRMANWVTDVPGLEQPVRPRGYLNVLAAIWKKKSENVYSLLFLKTFTRSGDYFGLYSRLTVIGALLMILVRNSSLFAIIIFGLVIFLTTFQLLGLSKHDFPMAMEGLYPLDPALKRIGFLRVMRFLILSQTLILSLVFFLTHFVILPFLLMLILGVGVTVIWMQLLSRRLKIEQL